MSNRAKPRLLLIAHGFPPAVAIGTVRPWNMALQLARLGWQVEVLTPRAALWRRTENAETVYATLRREGIALRETGHDLCDLSPASPRARRFPHRPLRGLLSRLGFEPNIGWWRHALRACRDLRPGDVDLILVSAMPFCTLQLAGRLARRLRCPFVMDYRDLWIDSPHSPALVRPLHRKWEQDLIARAGGTVFVSSGMAERQGAVYRFPREPLVLTNGFSVEDYADVPVQPVDHPAVVYAGNFIPPFRIVDPVMAAIRRLEDDGALAAIPWRFHYYGYGGDHFAAAAARCGVTARTVVDGPVARQAARAAVKNACLTVVISSVKPVGDPEDLANIPGKLFEPLAMQSPVLLVAAPGGNSGKLVAATGSGACCAGDDIDGIADAIRRAVTGQMAAPVLPAACDWTQLVRELDGYLRPLLPGAAAGVPS